jgi:hypothetical protein
MIIGEKALILCPIFRYFMIFAREMKIVAFLFAVLFAFKVEAQTGLKKVYDEDINPIEQIDKAVAKAKLER